MGANDLITIFIVLEYFSLWSYLLSRYIKKTYGLMRLLWNIYSLVEKVLLFWFMVSLRYMGWDRACQFKNDKIIGLYIGTNWKKNS